VKKNTDGMMVWLSQNTELRSAPTLLHAVRLVCLFPVAQLLRIWGHWE